MGGKGGGGGGGGWQLTYPGMGGGQQQQQQKPVMTGDTTSGEKTTSPARTNTQPMSVDQKSRLAAAGKGAAVGGALAGVPGALIGAYSGYKGGGVGEVGHGEFPILDNSPIGKFGTARADMQGRTLNAGEIPMRPGSDYGRYNPGGPPMRRGASLLESDDDEADNLGYGSEGQTLGTSYK